MSLPNLISCGECAVVLDADKLNFAEPSQYYCDDGSINKNRVDHLFGLLVPYVKCPVCDEPIWKEMKHYESA